MAFLRAFLIVVALVFFVFAAVPLQWLPMRRGSVRAHKMSVSFCRLFLRILRVSIDVSGDRLAKGPLLLVVNHVSWIDILIMGSLTPFCFLAKSEVAAWPLISSLAKMQGTVFMDRSRRRAIPPANREMARRMLSGRTMLLFPEGTTLGDAVPGFFFTSHFAAARDLLRADPALDVVFVQPTALAYSSSLAAWIGDEALVPHIWRVLRGAPLQCHVAFCPLIAFGRDSDRKAVARFSRDIIIAALTQRPVFTADAIAKADGAASNARGIVMQMTTKPAHDPQQKVDG